MQPMRKPRNATLKHSTLQSLQIVAVSKISTPFGAPLVPNSFATFSFANGKSFAHCTRDLTTSAPSSNPFKSRAHGCLTESGEEPAKMPFGSVGKPALLVPASRPLAALASLHIAGLAF